MARHRMDDEQRGAWQILKGAGIVLICVMGIGLLAIALAVGLATGMRMW